MFGNLIKVCGIPATLKEVKVTDAVIPHVAIEAVKIQRLLKNNPGPIEEKDAVEIYKAAY